MTGITTMPTSSMPNTLSTTLNQMTVDAATMETITEETITEEAMVVPMVATEPALQNVQLDQQFTLFVCKHQLLCLYQFKLDFQPMLLILNLSFHAITVDMELTQLQPPDMEPLDTEPLDMHQPDMHLPDMHPPDTEPPLMEPQHMEPPLMEPQHMEPPLMEPQDMELPHMEQLPTELQLPHLEPQSQPHLEPHQDFWVDSDTELLMLLALAVELLITAVFGCAATALLFQTVEGGANAIESQLLVRCPYWLVAMEPSQLLAMEQDMEPSMEQDMEPSTEHMEFHWLLPMLE